MQKKIDYFIIATMLVLLSVNNITAATLGGPYVNDDDTIALYHINDGSGTVVSDSSTNSYDGILYGSNTWSSSAKYQGGLQTASGQAGGYTASISVPGKSFTAEGWFKPDSVSGTQYILGGLNSSDSVFYVRQQGTSIYYGIYDPGATAWYEGSNSVGSLTAGEWYHVAVTFYNSTDNKIVMALYLNNVMEHRAEHNFTTLPDSITTLKVGLCTWNSSTYYFNGAIDEVRISNISRFSFTIPPNSQPNLVSNGDFELSGSSAPADWSSWIASGTNATLSWDTSEYVSSSRSTKIVLRGNSGVADWRQTINNIDDSIKYRLRSHIYATDVTSGSHAIEVNWLDSSDSYLGANSFSATTSNQWMEVAGEDIQPPTGTAKALITLRGYNKGTYYFDDVVLQRKDENVSKVDGKFPLGVFTPSTRHLLRNSNFEMGAYNNLPMGWGRLCSAGTVSQSWDSTYKVSGSYSCKTVVSTAGNADWRQHVYDIDPTLDYKLSAYIRASDVSSGSHGVYVYWLKADGSVLGQSVLTSTTANQWVQKSNSAISPPSLTVSALVVLSTFKVGTYYFDDVSLDVDMTEVELLADHKDAGFNFVGTYDNQYATYPWYDQDQYPVDLDDCDSASIKGCFYPLPNLYLPNDDNKAALTTTINSVEDHNALEIWFAPDEPTLQSPVLTALGIANAYNHLLATDDYYTSGSHKVWLNHPPFGSINDKHNFPLLRDYNTATDIISTDVYPVPESCSYSILPNQTISSVGDYVDILYNQVAKWDNNTTPRSNQEKPIWMCLQGGYAEDDYWQGLCYPMATHGIELQWYDDSWNYKGYDRISANSSMNWCYEELQSITPPVGSTQVFVLLRIYWSGSYYFDDVFFGEVGGSSLISNNTFETANGSMPAGWSTWVASGSEVTQTWDTSKYVSSSHSVKTVMTTLYGQSDWRQLVTNISDTKKYKLSGNIYAQRRPSKEQTRFMAYNSIIHGARGIVYYGCEYVPLTSKAWQYVREVVGEIDGLSTPLTSPRSFRDVYVSNGNIETLLVESGGYLYLVAANKKPSTASSVTLTVSGLPLSTIVRIYETGTLSISSNSFTDSFDGYQVHVYKLN